MLKSKTTTIKDKGVRQDRKGQTTEIMRKAERITTSWVTKNIYPTKNNPEKEQTSSDTSAGVFAY